MGSERIQHGPVRGLRAGRYGSSATTSALCYHVGRTLIDTGPPNQWRRVRPFVDALAEGPGLDRVLLTHHHEDHAGNAGRIQERLGVPVYAPASSLERLRDGFSIETYRWVVWGRPARVDAEPLPEAMTLPDGSPLRPVAAPGHTDDMVCYLAEGPGCLFSADLFVTRRPSYLRFDEDVNRIAESIRAVLEHPFQTVFCAHRGVVEDGRTALREKARYLEALCGVVRRRYRSDKRTAPDITEEILGSEGLLYWLSGGDFAKRHLVASCLHPAGQTEGETEGEIVT
jgi:glyoxylase-like metal-dependent hydrolase (beta-lactamase superfamily II)